MLELLLAMLLVLSLLLYGGQLHPVRVRHLPRLVRLSSFMLRMTLGAGWHLSSPCVHARWGVGRVAALGSTLWAATELELAYLVLVGPVAGLHLMVL